MNKVLQAEIWETQVWLMFILSVLLFETERNVLGWIVVVYGFISLAGAIAKLLKARFNELKNDK